MRKRKISNGPQQMGCSDGAKMLIDQMKEHPEEFRGYAGKFRGMVETAQEVVRGAMRSMSKRDAHAIMAAAETHLFEVWLAEEVLTSIMKPKPEVEKDTSMTATFGHRAVGKSVLSQLSGNAISNSAYSNGNIASNTINSQQYTEQVYRAEMDRYKMELEKQRQEEQKYAMRNTKPFKNFL